MKTAQITVEYLDHLGTDLTVVNAARTSFGKESDWDERDPEQVGEFGHLLPKRLKPEDANLIRYLATGFRTKEWDALLDEIVDQGRNGGKDGLTDILLHYKKSAQHFAPFAHPHLSLRMKLPIFLARQFVKHQVGGVWSEESRRYMSSEPEFWFPKEWHGRPEDIKQGSGGLIEEMIPYLGSKPVSVGDVAEEATEHSVRTYMSMVRQGVAPEEARIVLPLNTMTTVTWTGSLLFWSRVCNQRVDSHAQLAAQELGRQIADIVRPRYPVSWAALCGE